MKHLESEIQQAAIAMVDEWFALAHADKLIPVERKVRGVKKTFMVSPLYANQNAYSGNPRQGARSVKEGVRSGVWDLTLPIPAGGFHGMYIEVKTPTGSLSKNQRSWLEHYQANKYITVICRSADDILKCVQEYMLLAEGAR